MTEKERRALATLIRTRRQDLGMSLRELARQSQLDVAALSRLDQAKIAQPTVATIRALADALNMPVADFYAATNWLPEGELPSIRPYMRAKYEGLPDEAVDQVERYIARLSRKYDRGPRPGEDEWN